MAATLTADGSILCSPTPSHLALLAEPTSSPVGAEALRFSVSLNGQQFSNSTIFYSYSPHNASLISPSSGPFLGETLVNFSTSHPILNASASMAMCRFGQSVVEATLLSESGVVLCTSPTAVAAGTLPERREQFSELPAGSELHGVAQLRGGTLRLTPSAGEGSFALSVPNKGSTTLNLTFDLLLGHGAAPEGVSVVYGPMPSAAFGETGTGLGSPPPNVGGLVGGEGLEVWIRTGELDLLQVRLPSALTSRGQMYLIAEISVITS
jgi:hypothetical protein